MVEFEDKSAAVSKMLYSETIMSYNFMTKFFNKIFVSGNSSFSRDWVN